MKKLWSFVAVLLIMLIPLVNGSCKTEGDSNKELDRSADGVYVGTALRGETSCFSNDYEGDGRCAFCTETDSIELVRDKSNIRIVTKGPSLTFEPCKRGQSDYTAFTLQGVTNLTPPDNADWTKFEITKCSIVDGIASGGGSLDDDRITASFSCRDNHNDGSLYKVEWNDVVLTKQER